jgi:hypothetical protein
VKWRQKVSEKNEKKNILDLRAAIGMLVKCKVVPALN